MLRHQADAATLPWLEMLDRGRYTNSLRHSRNRDEWAAIFAAAGLRIARHQPFIPAAVARVYDIGLRPLFPVLMNLRETLQRCCPDDLPRLKQRWLETLTRHLLPLCDEAWQQRLSPGHAWHCFELVPD
jgi:hypothetical protein